MPRSSLLFVLVTCLGVRGSAAMPEKFDAAVWTDHAMTHVGDPEAGRVVFNDAARAKCAACHQVRGEGGQIGPNLSRIGGKFDRIHLIESILEPSKQVVEGYRTSRVLTVDGEVLAGVIKQKTAESFVLIGSDASQRKIMSEDVEEILPSPVSTMPEGLADSLTPTEFTDLVAYMESLRDGLGGGFGADTKGPIKLAEGFKLQTVTTGLSGAVNMEVLPDGRVLVCEQTGSVRVIKDGELLDEPMLHLDVEHYWERGLIGVTHHPKFPQQPYIYVTYVVERPYTHHVISRFRVDGDKADPASELIFLEGDDQSKLGGFKPSGHQGGGMHFGADGKLYIGLGEQTAEDPAQELDTLQGKILCFNDDGTIPKDNPFFDQTTGKYRSIWAIGCRNPFSFAINRRTGLMLINDVGGKFEEINLGVAGANYGWPIADHGPVTDERFTGPIHWYRESSINGGDFTPPGGPELLEDRYVFADFVRGWVRHLDPHSPGEALDLVTGLRRPVDIRFDRDGSLYVLLRNAWIMDDKFEGGTGSLLKITATK